MADRHRKRRSEPTCCLRAKISPSLLLALDEALPMIAETLHVLADHFAHPQGDGATIASIPSHGCCALAFASGRTDRLEAFLDAIKQRIQTIRSMASPVT